MNKCPSCGAALGALAKVCEACGSVIIQKASPVSEASTAVKQQESVADLCNKINSGINILNANKPPSNLSSFLIGMATTSTFGLAYLVYKFIYIFSRIGRSPNRVLLEVNQAMSTAKTYYSSDAQVRDLLEKSTVTLQDYNTIHFKARNKFILGMIVAAIMWLLIIFITDHYNKEEANTIEKKRVESEKVEYANKYIADVKQKEEEKKQEAGKKEAYVNKYVAATDAKKTSKIRLAVIAADEKHRDMESTMSLSRALKDDTFEVTDGLFSDSFVTDGLFEKLFDSDREEMNKLRLPEKIDQLLIIKEKKNIEYSTTINSHITMFFHLIDAKTGALINSFTLDGRGTGTNADKANSLACAEIINQFKQQKADLFSSNQNQ